MVVFRGGDVLWLALFAPWLVCNGQLVGGNDGWVGGMLDGMLKDYVGSGI